MSLLIACQLANHAEQHLVEMFHLSITLSVVGCGSALLDTRRAYLMKWSIIMRTFFTMGGLFSSIVDSILVKTRCTNSNGVYTQIGQRGALGTSPSNAQQCGHSLTIARQSSTIIGHQNLS